MSSQFEFNLASFIFSFVAARGTRLFLFCMRVKGFHLHAHTVEEKQNEPCVTSIIYELILVFYKTTNVELSKSTSGWERKK